MGEISFGKAIDDRTLKTEFLSIPVDPGLEGRSTFRVIMHRTWTRMPTSGDLNGMLRITKFRAGSAQVDVLYTYLPYEVNLVDWLTWAAYSMSWKIAELRSGNGEWGQIIHAEGTDSEGLYLRLMVTGNASDVFLIVGSAPGNRRQEIERLGLCAASFAFDRPSSQKTREPLVLYRESALQVTRPVSWDISPRSTGIPDKTAVDFRIVGNNRTAAYLRLESDTRSSRDIAGLEVVFRKAIEEVEESGLKIEDLIQMTPNARNPERHRWAGEFRTKDGHGQIALLFREAPKSWLIAILVAPDRDEDALSWMRAERFYELVDATLREPPETGVRQKRRIQ